jgi:hypothetical protein
MSLLFSCSDFHETFNYNSLFMFLFIMSICLKKKHNPLTKHTFLFKLIKYMSCVQPLVKNTTASAP